MSEIIHMNAPTDNKSRNWLRVMTSVMPEHAMQLGITTAHVSGDE